MSDYLLKSKAGALLLGAAGLTAAGLAYYYMQSQKKEDDACEKLIFGKTYDSALHNIGRLHSLMEEYFYEVVQNHLQICLLIRALKVQGKYKAELLEGLKAKVKELNQTKKESICTTAGIPRERFDAWTQARLDDEIIKHYVLEMNGITEDVFIKE